MLCIYSVRLKDKHIFALSLSHNKVVKHYKIDKIIGPNGEEQLAIEDGPRFDNLMDVS